MEAFQGFIMVYFYIWILVTIHFGCFADYCQAFFLWNSSSVLWIKKLHSTFYQHEGEKIVTEFSFLDEVSL